MAEFTPMMKHYLEIKKEHPEALIFYRLGDFYELFFDDAKLASRELDLTLTGRSAGQKDKVPMCGVPHHAVNGYIQRLINKGYKLAIVEQLEDPAQAIGLVKRDIIKIITPGTILDDSLDEKQSIYLGAIEDYRYGYAITITELATGQTTGFLLDHDSTELVQFIKAKGLKELVVSSEMISDKKIRKIAKMARITLSECDDDELKPTYEKLLVKIDDQRIRKSFARLTNYLELTQKQVVSNLEPLSMNRDSDFLQMDYATKQNLELVVPLHTSTGNLTLWNFMDHCCGAMGSRLLKNWVEYPLTSKNEIMRRQQEVAFLIKNYQYKDQLKKALNETYDLERLISKIALGSLNARDCMRLDKTLTQSPIILNIMKLSGLYPEFEKVNNGQEADKLVKDVFLDEPPIYTNEGGMFLDGYDPRLDELRSIQKNGKKWLLDYENQEKERTGIKNLKISYNRIFGYCIEISKGNLNLVKDEFGYVRKQTLTTGERFITAELKAKEDDILHAEEHAILREKELFAELLKELQKHTSELQALAKVIALADCLYTLSIVSSNPGYICPEFNDNRNLNIVQGRHPIIESINLEDPYIPNDVDMDKGNNILIITGPNMGGKSTYMRQMVLLIIMAQIGCYIPAKQATLPIFDKIFTRIGASDDILSGQSTFMMEMSEANRALKNATKNSFILFDEIGRGTATYDGMSLAQAILEYIATGIGAKTMFSTHYHELTSLEETDSTIKNVHVQVHEDKDEITFLYKVKKGPADKSYGINVAKLAGLPDSVLTRAKSLLKVFEQQQKAKINAQSQIIMMEKVPENLDKINSILQKIDPNQLTPIEALQLVNDLKMQANKHEGND